MSVTIHAIKRLGALRASDAPSEEALRAIPDGELVRVEITRPSKRSVRMHRLFFSLVSLASEQVGFSTDQMLCWLKIAVGHFDTVVSPKTGEVAFMPKSIAFHRMDQTTFNKFFDDSVNAILERLLPDGTSKQELIEEVYGRIGAPQERACA